MISGKTLTFVLTGPVSATVPATVLADPGVATTLGGMSGLDDIVILDASTFAASHTSPWIV